MTSCANYFMDLWTLMCTLPCA